MIGRVLKPLVGLSLAVLLIIPSVYVFLVGNERLIPWLRAGDPTVVGSRFQSKGLLWQLRNLTCGLRISERPPSGTVTPQETPPQAAETWGQLSLIRSVLVAAW